MVFAILDFLQTIHNPVLDAVMCALSAAGNGGLLWILLGIALLFWKRTRKEGIIVLLILLGCLIVGNLILKNAVARPRPCWLNPAVELLIPVPEDFSFPSGHTMAGFSVSFYLWLKNRKWGSAALVLAALIAFSRMYLYVHFPTDILGGLLIGLALGYAGMKTENLWNKKTSPKTP